jgi:hypothetical protein
MHSRRQLYRLFHTPPPPNRVHFHSNYQPSQLTAECFLRTERPLHGAARPSSLHAAAAVFATYFRAAESRVRLRRASVDELAAVIHDPDFGRPSTRRSLALRVKDRSSLRRSEAASCLLIGGLVHNTWRQLDGYVDDESARRKCSSVICVF